MSILVAVPTLKSLLCLLSCDAVLANEFLYVLLRCSLHMSACSLFINRLQVDHSFLLVALHSFIANQFSIDICKKYLVSSIASLHSHRSISEGK